MNAKSPTNLNTSAVSNTSRSSDKSDEGYKSDTVVHESKTPQTQKSPVTKLDQKTLNQQELKRKYSIKSIIQSSSIAQIYSAIDRETHQEVIIKRSLRSRCLAQEINFIERAHKICPETTLPIIYKQECSKYVVFVIPKFGKSLYDFMISRNRVLTLQEAQIVFQQILDCLTKLQVNSIYHLDIKEENILIDPNTYQVKLIDFGCSVAVPVSSRKIVGSREFCSPEIFLGQSNASSLKKHDVWSFAVAMISSMTGDTPYTDISKLVKGEENFEIKSSKNLTVDEIFSCELRFLLSCMLDMDPNKRISFSDLGKSKFFGCRS